MNLSISAGTGAACGRRVGFALALSGLLTLNALAQPAPTPSAPPVTASAIPAPGASTKPSDSGPRSLPRPMPPLRKDSIVVPSSGAVPVPGSAAASSARTSSVPVILPTDQVIVPSTNSALAGSEELIPPGTIDFRGMDLNMVLMVYADLVKRTMLRGANLTAPPITLQTQTPLTRREAVQALDAVLALNNIAIINIGDKFSKAVPLNVANQMGAKFSTMDATNLPDMGQYMTHVVQLRYSKPSELVQVLQPFASAIPNAVFPIDSSQILVLRDLTENVKRMLELIREIDVSVPSEYISEVIPIKYALSSEIASAINSLSSGGGGTTVGGGARTGSSGTRTTGFGTRSGGVGGNGGNYPGSVSPGGGITPGSPTTPTQQPGSTGNSFSDRLRNLVQKASASGDIQVLGQTKIIADERTNSLLIYASREDMRIIKDIIAKLDVVLAQVLIEAVIIEVNLNNERDLGVSYLAGPSKSGGNFTGIGALNNGTLLNGGSFGSAASNAVPGGFSYLAQFGNDLDVTLTAAANDSRAKILQRPRIQTSHAVQATLFVGESRPYPTASYYGGGSFGGYSSIQQVQIGVTLDVTPLINPDGLVVMDIHQTIESANGTVNIVNVGDVPITSRKEAQAKVAVRDHDTIMLGGLIETSKSKSNTGVPFLKDMPMLGFFFRGSSDKEVRNELIVLIRPTVLPTPEVAAVTARAEKARMPEIRRAETEIQNEENKRIKAADKYFQEGQFDN